MRAPVLITPPSAPPVWLDQVKAHLRIDASAAEEDGLIEGYVDTATAALDGWSGLLGRALMPQVWRQDFEGWHREMRLPLAPVQSVDAVRYTDAGGAPQTFAEFDLVVDGIGPKLCLREAGPQIEAGSVIEVEFTAGYADATSVPAPIRTAIMAHVATLWHHRETVSDGRVAPNGNYEAMVRPYRRIGL